MDCSSICSIVAECLLLHFIWDPKISWAFLRKAYLFLQLLWFEISLHSLLGFFMESLMVFVPFFKVSSRRLKKQRTGCWNEKEMTGQSQGPKDMSLSVMEGLTLTCGNPRSLVRNSVRSLSKCLLNISILCNVLRVGWGGINKPEWSELLVDLTSWGWGAENGQEWAEQLPCVSHCIKCLPCVLSCDPRCTP